MPGPLRQAGSQGQSPLCSQRREDLLITARRPALPEAIAGHRLAIGSAHELSIGSSLRRPRIHLQPARQAPGSSRWLACPSTRRRSAMPRCSAVREADGALGTCTCRRSSAAGGRSKSRFRGSLETWGRPFRSRSDSCGRGSSVGWGRACRPGERPVAFRALVALAAVQPAAGGQARKRPLQRQRRAPNCITCRLSNVASGRTSFTCPETARSIAASKCRKKSSVASANGLLFSAPNANCEHAVQPAPDLGLDHQQRIAARQIDLFVRIVGAGARRGR